MFCLGFFAGDPSFAAAGRFFVAGRLFATAGGVEEEAAAAVEGHRRGRRLRRLRLLGAGDARDASREAASAVAAPPWSSPSWQGAPETPAMSCAEGPAACAGAPDPRLPSKPTPKMGPLTFFVWFGLEWSLRCVVPPGKRSPGTISVAQRLKLGRVRLFEQPLGNDGGADSLCQLLLVEGDARLGRPCARVLLDVVVKQAVHAIVDLVGERGALLLEVLQDARADRPAALFCSASRSAFSKSAAASGVEPSVSPTVRTREMASVIASVKVADGGAAPRRVLAHLKLVLLVLAAENAGHFAAVQPLRHQPVREGEDGVQVGAQREFDRVRLDRKQLASVRDVFAANVVDFEE